jgi:hypothetical protein
MTITGNNILMGSSGGGYTANAVRFDGTNDYLTRGADLTGCALNDQFAFSVWINFKGGDGVEQYILNSDGDRVNVYKDTSNNIRVIGKDPSGTVTSFHSTSTTAYTAATGWIHIAVAFHATTAWMYINDSDDQASYSDGAALIGYPRSDWSIGGKTGGTSLLNAEVADLWFLNHSGYDLSVESNRRSFISVTGKPVEIERSGRIFMSGDTADWHTNKGLGGGFTENGALTDAASSPSDLRGEKIK